MSEQMTNLHENQKIYDMERHEIIDTMMILYSRRVKSLLGTDDDGFIRELLELIFVRFEQIARKPTHTFYAVEMQSRISDMLDKDPNVKASQEDMRNLAGRLEEYIQLNIQDFWPNKTFKYNPKATKAEREMQDYRKFIGEKIRLIAEDTTGKYALPIKLDKETSYKIFKQLYQVTQSRNRLTHLRGASASVMYIRSHYLEMSEILLSYILQTYYYLCLSMNVKLTNDELWEP